MPNQIHRRSRLPHIKQCLRSVDRHRKWRTIVARLAATLFCAATASSEAIAQSAGEWIVTGTDAAEETQQQFQASFAGSPDAPELEVVESRNGLSIVRVDPQSRALVQNVVHLDFHRCGGYTVHPTRESALRELNNPIYQPGFVHSEGIFASETIDQQATVSTALEKVDAAKIVETIHRLETLGTRHYESAGGEEAAALVTKLWTEYAAGRNDVSVERVDHDWRQDSVIASIRGSTEPEEIVVLGAHLDSIHNADNDDAPGADDDASGIAVVSETLRVLMEIDFRPQRTIQFMAYAAEEVGLRGSAAIVGEYAGAGRNVVGALQLDMTGFRGSEKDMYFVTDFVNPHLTEFLQDLIAAYNSSGEHTITFGETTCGYACSDHASWTRNGYPAGFPFEAQFTEYNRKIHTPEDLTANLDSTGEHQTRFAKLAAEFAIELGTISPPSLSAPQ
jgi:bacterial leucyl aminopeptidase